MSETTIENPGRRGEVEPRRTDRWRHPRWPILAGAGVAAGVTLALVWSARFVDRVIGDNVASGLLGYDASDGVIAGGAAGLLFAVITGLAGSFTACNIAVLGAAPQLASTVAGGARTRLRMVLTSMAWLAGGVLAVSATYGMVAVLVGSRMPQATTGSVARDAGIPPLLAQTMLAYGVIGLAFGYLGLAALGVVPDPFTGRPQWRLFTIGALVGGFLVGRPFALFRRLFAHAVEESSPGYGALAFGLQSLGNIMVMVALALLLVFGTRGRFLRWLTARPGRAAALTGVALLAFGVFILVYWEVRVPAIFGVGWFPTLPWNA